MKLTLSNKELSVYTSKQLNFFFPDNNPVDLTKFEEQVDHAIQRLEYCFKHCTWKNYNDGQNTYFNHLHSDHYMMYLWYLANTLWTQKAERELASKLYYLNKTLHGLDCVYDTKLPDIFLIFHGLGTVLGKATYADFFVVLQGCTVGAQKGKYPVMDKGVALTSHSSLIGDCHVGKNVSLSAYTNVFETTIPDSSTVFKNSSGEIIIKPSKQSFAQSFFNVPIA